MTQLSTAYISSLFSSAISLLILLVVLIWRPQGLVAGGVGRRQDTRDEVKAAGHAAKLPAHLAWPLAALAVLVAVLIPFVITDNGIMSGLVIAGILFMTLMGLDVLMGYAGQVSLGQAGFMAIGGYTSGYLAINYRDCAGTLDPRRHRRLGSLRAGALGGDVALARALSRAGDAGLRAA